MSVKSKNTQYDILASDEKYEADKFHILHEFYSEHNNGKEIAEKALRSMGFYDENGFLANGAVLFQDGYDGRKHKYSVLFFQDLQKAVSGL